MPVYRRLPTRIAILTILAFPGWSPGADPEISFSRDVRPILATHCFACHGPDASQREGDLRLDVREGAASVLEPGNAKASEIVRRIRSVDPDEQMPPPEAKKPLTEAQKRILQAWIDAGASWSDHWAYSPIQAPPPPEVTSFGEAAPVRNAIDRFVQAKLAARGWTPSPEADRVTLLRRLALDLTGLPPTPAETDRFLEDSEPGAYERLVDRLLQSSAFGERMAWNWLDAARYADSNGYQGDRERTMWPWRDWVVGALNQNLAFDEFTIWQLAGDLLEQPTFEQRLATGFCRNHMINGEGGRIPEENRVDYAMDMTETVGTVWLAATLNCCRCHDHKFDPMLQREYYQFLAFFNQTPINGGGGNPQTPPVLAAPTREQRGRETQLKKQLEELREQLNDSERTLIARMPEWETRRLTRGAKSPWRVLKPMSFSAESQTLQRLPDESLLAGGDRAATDRYNVELALAPGRLSALRLEALRHKSLNGNSLSRAESGNFVLTGFSLTLVDAKGVETPLKISSATATFEQGPYKINKAYDGSPETGWAVYEGRLVDREHAAAFRLASAVDIEEGSRLRVRLEHQSQHEHHNLGRFRFAASERPDAALGDKADAVLADLRTPPSDRTKEQLARIRQAMLSEDAGRAKIVRDLDDRQKQLQSLQASYPKVMVMADQPAKRATFVLDRGLYNKPTIEVAAGTPAHLPALSQTDNANRLTLAKWLMSPQHPLTARVAVNRIWQQFFGVALVKTSEDFGMQGEHPLHQDLLDHLAASFRDEGWDRKQLIKTIVMSHTYRQSSKIDDKMRELDPDNRFLSRGARFRMPAWMLRDQALAASGLLVRRLGGPPVNGYQPPGVWEEATFGKKQYRRDSGEALYRRSIYTFWRRIIAPTVFFDSASRQTCTVNIKRTNTPLHALTTLNDVTFVEAARALAERALLAEPKDAKARLDLVYRCLLVRKPSPREREILLAGLERTKRQFAQRTMDAEKLLAVGESSRNESLDATLHGSWTALCLAVLNLDETLTRE